MTARRTNSFRRPGIAHRLTAPVGGVVAWEPYVVGQLVVVAQEDAAEGEPFTGWSLGVYEFPKGAFAATEGAPAYLDLVTRAIEGTDTATNRRIGVFVEAASAGAAWCMVSLDGVSLGAGGDLEAKADKVVPTAAGNVAVLTAGGNLEDGGALPEPGETTPRYADLTALRTASSAGLTAGDPVIVRAVTAADRILPAQLSWAPEYDVSDLDDRASAEPFIVVPDDVWGTEEEPGPRVGAWVQTLLGHMLAKHIVYFGENVYSGIGAPSAELGTDGDLYVDYVSTSTPAPGPPVLYKRVLGLWAECNPQWGAT